MLRPGCSSTVTFGSRRIASRSAGVGRDGEHDVVELRLALPVVREGAIADHRVLLVLQQIEGTRADRLLVDLLGRAGLQHGVGVVLRLDRGERHGEVGQERRLGRGQRELDRVVVDPLDGCQQLRQPHVVEVGVVAAGHLEERVVLLPLPLEGEDHVVRVEVAGRLEGPVRVPLHALAEVEDVGLAVVRHVPALRQARDHLGGAALEVDEPAIDLGAGVEGGAGRVDRRIEVLGAALGAEHQGLGPGRHGPAGGRDGQDRHAGQTERAEHREPSGTGEG